MHGSLSHYSIKILIAWGEAISGNATIRDWLIKNDFQELGLFCFALRNNEEARKWLFDAGFPQFMALINGGEGNTQALQWLFDNGFEDFYYMALAIDNDEKGEKWVLKNMSKEIILLTQKIRFVKNRIDADNNDFHRFNNT